MHSRRHVIKISLLGGFAAGVGQLTPVMAQDEKSTPAAEPTKNGVLTNVLDQLPRADDGEFAPVAWGSGVLEGEPGAKYFVLIHNNTDEELILRQGWGKLIDADGNILEEMVKVSGSAPYSYEPDSYGLQELRIESELSGVTEIELEMKTDGMSEATGAVSNVTITNVERTNDRGSLAIHVRNDADVGWSYVPTVGIFFDEEMNIVGGGSNLGLAIGPNSEGVVDLPSVLMRGETTDRYLFAAFGSE